MVSVWWVVLATAQATVFAVLVLFWLKRGADLEVRPRDAVLELLDGVSGDMKDTLFRGGDGAAGRAYCFCEECQRDSVIALLVDTGATVSAEMIGDEEDD